jgi:Zn-dependent peptidase ImmA (M78 family)
MSRFTDEEWEEIGRVWLRAAGQAELDRPDAIRFVKWLKQSGHIKDYVRVPNAELPKADGKFDPDSECIVYRQDIWDAAERGNPRAIWTIWHEASHAIQRHQQVRFRSSAASKARPSASAGKDEFEANRLAACLVAPFDKSGFHPGTTVDDLRRRFDLSQEAAEKRLAEFNLM